MVDMRVFPAPAAASFGVVGNAAGAGLLAGVGTDVLTTAGNLVCQEWAADGAIEVQCEAGIEAAAGEAGVEMIGTFVRREAANTEALII